VRIPNGTACGIRTAPFIQRGCGVGERTNEVSNAPLLVSLPILACLPCLPTLLPPLPWQLLTVLVVRALICRRQVAVSKVGGVGVIDCAAFVLSIARCWHYRLCGVGVINCAALALLVGRRWHYRFTRVWVMTWPI